MNGSVCFYVKLPALANIWLPPVLGILVYDNLFIIIIIPFVGQFEMWCRGYRIFLIIYSISLAPKLDLFLSVDKDLAQIFNTVLINKEVPRIFSAHTQNCSGEIELIESIFADSSSHQASYMHFKLMTVSLEIDACFVCFP